MKDELICKWVKCHLIDWEDENKNLPSSLESICITLPNESDNFDLEVSTAINNYLKSHYHANGHCMCFSIYNDTESKKLDLQLLLNACFK